MKPLTPEQRDEILNHFDAIDVIELWEFRTALKLWLDENTVDITPPTIIYKGSGFTGAQKDERYREEE